MKNSILIILALLGTMGAIVGLWAMYQMDYNTYLCIAYVILSLTLVAGSYNAIENKIK